MAAHKFNYYKAFAEMADFARQAAGFLDDVVNNYDTGQLLARIDEMHHIEHAADRKRHEIMNHLFREFLPPIEREDIVGLASRIDDVIDGMDDVMRHFYLYNIETLLPVCKDFSLLLIKCCESIQNIAKEFGNFRKSTTIRDSIIETNNLESQGDTLYYDAMRSLFTSGMSDKDILVWSKIIESLENCCDYCEDVSELFEMAIMKNS
jgi:predicted phosphate transport protein (TIGR00153 family)